MEAVSRLPNNYRIFSEHHIYQIKICGLVFSGFVNHNLRKASMKIIEAAKEWNLKKYENVTLKYIKLINEEIERAKKTISVVINNLGKPQQSDLIYTKKQAARLVGVTEEAIRNWERNELILRALPYQKRFYSRATLDRMHLIRLLLHNGFSIMIIRKFFMYYDSGEYSNAIAVLMDPGESEDLMTISDRYLQSLYELSEKAKQMYLLLDDMKKT